VTSFKALKEKINFEKHKEFERFRKKNNGLIKATLDSNSLSRILSPVSNHEIPPQDFNSGSQNTIKEESATKLKEMEIKEEMTRANKKKTKSIIPGLIRVQKLEVLRKLISFERKTELETIKGDLESMEFSQSPSVKKIKSPMK